MDLLPSACIWVEQNPGRIDPLLRSLKQSAYHYIDVEPKTLGEGSRKTVDELGLKVSCIALDHGRIVARCHRHRLRRPRRSTPLWRSMLTTTWMGKSFTGCGMVTLPRRVGCRNWW